MRFVLPILGLILLISLAGCGSGSSSSSSSTPPPTVVKLKVSPTAPFVVTGGQLQFSAALNTNNTPVTWSVEEGVAGGTITSTGLYTAPNNTGTFHVVAVSAYDSTNTATVPVVVIGPLTLTPASTTLVVGASQAFSAVVNTTPDSGVTWSVKEGAAGGTITTIDLHDATYTAPNTPGTYHVVATNIANTSITATSVVTVIKNPVVISPQSAAVLEGATQQFTATLSGAPATNTVTWTVQEGATGGTITSAGLFTASANPGTYHVAAASPTNPNFVDVVQVTVVAPISITPPSFTEVENGTKQFVAMESGAAVTAKWSIQEGAAGGTITQTGLYTAPATPGTFHLVATDPNYAFNAAVATVTVIVPVSITPSSVTLSVITGTQTFTASLNGTPTAVTWSIQEGAAGGTITQTGVYTAPALPGTYHVVATSQANSFNFAVATVTVQAGGSNVNID